MKNKFAEFAIKTLKAIIKIISIQLINYISSEEFSIKVKQLIQDIVAVLVKVVLAEKNAITNNDKNTIIY